MKNPFHKKEISPQETFIRSFLDCIAPGVVKFEVDHYIFGNTYRCVWALREYPASTESQAILRHLGEKSGVTLRIYCRQVSPGEEDRIIDNANKKNKLDGSDPNKLRQTVEAESNLRDVAELVHKMHREHEPLLHCAVYLEMTADSAEHLRQLQADVLTELVRCKLNVDKLLLRQKQGFYCASPVGYNALGREFERVLPAGSVANLYPFNYSGKTDPNGFYIGKDKYGSNIVVDFARRGIEAFVLRYDCAPAPLGTRPLAALSAAVQWVRAHAAQYGISPQRIAVGGFSAGAHLAGLHAAVWNRASWYPQGTDLALHQPNAAVLCYPVVSAGEYAHRGSFEQLAGDDMEKQQAFSLETLVSPDMPRTFLWHTLTDETVPVENSLLLEKSLRRAGVSHEMHLFPHGVHGLALADMETSDIEKGRLPDRHIARWQALCAEWLKE